MKRRETYRSIFVLKPRALSSSVGFSPIPFQDSCLPHTGVFPWAWTKRWFREALGHLEWFWLFSLLAETWILRISSPKKKNWLEQELGPNFFARKIYAIKPKVLVKKPIYVPQGKCLRLPSRLDLQGGRNLKKGMVWWWNRESLRGGKITPENGGMAYFQGRTVGFREGMFCWGCWWIVVVMLVCWGGWWWWVIGNALVASGIVLVWVVGIWCNFWKKSFFRFAGKQTHCCVFFSRIIMLFKFVT